jgi:Putative bacterial sensory transduction regulator
MGAMNFTELRACLEKDGWPIEPLSEVTLRSCFRGAGRMFPVFVHCEPEHVTFAVIPFLRLPDVGATNDARVVDRLLHLNREMNLAKFSVDEDGDVVLSVEYRLADLDPSEVKDAIDVLSFYAEKYHPEMRLLVGTE